MVPFISRQIPAIKLALGKMPQFWSMVEPVGKCGLGLELGFGSRILTQIPQFFLCQNAQEVRVICVAALFSHFKKCCSQIGSDMVEKLFEDDSLDFNILCMSGSDKKTDSPFRTFI